MVEADLVQRGPAARKKGSSLSICAKCKAGPVWICYDLAFFQFGGLLGMISTLNGVRGPIVRSIRPIRIKRRAAIPGAGQNGGPPPGFWDYSECRAYSGLRDVLRLWRVSRPACGWKSPSTAELGAQLTSS